MSFANSMETAFSPQTRDRRKTQRRAETVEEHTVAEIGG